MSGPRNEAVRVRRGRVCLVAVAALVTLVAVLGGVGVLPNETPVAAASDGPSAGEQATPGHPDHPHDRGRASTATPTPHVGPVALPADSGEGKRIVFDISDQRVWLVDASDAVRRTYLVSGSLTDNLSPGTFAVYSKSRWAVGVDDSGVMQYFVRFTRGDNAAIGFHSIPTKDGRALQTRAQLGTPQSHGCIRQALPDAIRLWNFAPVGTKVVVTA